MNFSLQLDSDPMTIRSLRASLRAWLAETRCRDECPDNVELVVSELVTNALVHGHSAPEVRAVVTQDRVHVEVDDDQPAPPVMRSPQGPAGGFGLHLVEAVCVDWGWIATKAGKVVWADIAL